MSDGIFKHIKVLGRFDSHKAPYTIVTILGYYKGRLYTGAGAAVCNWEDEYCRGVGTGVAYNKAKRQLCQLVTQGIYQHRDHNERRFIEKATQIQAAVA